MKILINFQKLRPKVRKKNFPKLGYFQEKLSQF